ncbi:MAG: PEP-CTERM sorting domain-containing protein [Armatimonadetes bacterium]|nr:PEP-CTERM sorting domain-containing protein [Armatimonadota bacterium]
MIKRLLILGAVVGVSVPASAITVVQWDFNNSLTNPSTGSGSLALQGGVVSSSASGSGSTDAGSPNNSINTATYPAQGTGSGTAGIAFFTDTTGFQNVSVTWDQRLSNTASLNWAVEYTTDGSTWNAFSTYQGIGTTTFFNNNSADFSSITGVNNNANFGFRFVSIFAPGGAGYVANGSTSTYGTTGTSRWDMVTVNADVVPEPATMGLLAAAGLGIAARRRRKS